MAKKILITGAAGFIGKALALYLSSRKGYKILGVDLKAGNIPGARLTKLDLLDHKRVVSFLRRQRPDTIFHLAGGRFVDVRTMLAANVRTTIGLFAALEDVAGYHPRVVVIGSAAEYGVTARRGAVTEKMSGELDSDYGALKLLQTTAALCFAKTGVNVVVARLFNILGPGLPVQTAGGKFARDIVMAERGVGPDSFVTGDLSAVRDFLDIRDICSALCLIARHGCCGEVYNVCSQKGIVMRRLLKDMLLLSRKVGLSFSETSGNPAGVLSSIGSCAKLKRITGWRPRYTFKQSLKATLEYYRQHESFS